MKVSEATLMFIDNSGSFVSFAERLGREFDHVFYFSQWVSGFPSSNDVLIGEGLDNIERVNSIWDYLEATDVFFFADCYNGDLQEYLAGIGKKVFGARRGDELELDRVGTKKLMGKLGLPVNEYKVVTGLDKLREYLKENEMKMVKVSRWRGDFESFMSVNYKISEPVLDELEHRLGAKKLIEEFIVEKDIPAVCEVGLDTYTIDGKYPSKVMFGYEIKDCGFGAVVKNYKDISPLITDVNNKFSDTLAQLNYRGFISTEIRITEDKVPYMIDFTNRLPSPPSELMQEMVKNWGEIVLQGADGILVEPEYTASYGVEIIIKSDWAGTNWQAIHFPDEIEQWVKLKNHTKIKGVHYFIPTSGIELHEIGAVVATGTSIENAVENVTKYIKQIEGYHLEMNTESIIEKLNEQVSNGEKIGISFLN